jgi:hypothetical protein
MMEFVCLFEHGKFGRLIDVGDDRAFFGNMRINNFGLYKYVLKGKSTYILKKNHTAASKKSVVIIALMARYIMG